MHVVYPRCCGLDVHKKHVSACLLVVGPGHQRTVERHSFGTTTVELHRLAAWLRDAGCDHVAMESTGSYWKPIYNVLEAEFDLVLANPQHVKGLPGRKTDIGDAEWLAELLQHGLIRNSFVPPKDLRELRELTRYRSSLIQERSAELNRIQKVLEGANIKLASVVTNIVGVSGRAMLGALIDGQLDTEQMAELARGRMRRKLPELRQALDGAIGPHQIFVLRQQLAHIDALAALIEACSTEIEQRLAPQQALVDRVCQIPGIGVHLAQVILAEIGTDMSRFPTHQHLASWAGMCPGNHESAGKRKSGRTRKGSRWLRTALVEAAHAAARTRTTYLGTQYRRLAARRGASKAAIAVGHTLLVIIYHLLADGTSYTERGAGYFDQLDRDRVRRRLTQRLEALGYTVTVAANADAPSAA